MKKNIFDFVKFCPACGKELGKLKLFRLIECKICGLNFYLNSVPTAAAILENKNGEILLVERKFDPKKGYWDLPGGFVDLDENLDEAIKRELKEELGIEVESLSLIGSSTDRYPFKGIIYSTVTAVYSGKVDGKIYPADDVAHSRFFDRKNIPWERFAFPELAKEIKKYIDKKYSP